MYLLHPSSPCLIVLMIEASTSETSVNLCQTMQCYNLGEPSSEVIFSKDWMYIHCPVKYLSAFFIWVTDGWSLWNGFETNICDIGSDAGCIQEVSRSDLGSALGSSWFFTVSIRKCSSNTLLPPFWTHYILMLWKQFILMSILMLCSSMLSKPEDI